MISDAEWVKSARLKANLSQEKLALAVNALIGARLDRSTINKVETQKRRLQSKEAAAISTICGVPLPHQIEDAPPTRVAATDWLPPAAVQVRREMMTPGPNDLPVRGVVAGNGFGDGAFRLQEEPVDFVRRPPGLINAKEAYALYVTGDSMYPVYRNGALIFVGPSRPASIGDDVVICLHPRHEGDPDEYLIKRLVRRTADELRVEQFSPPKILTFPQSRVRWVHKVLEPRELVGA